MKNSKGQEQNDQHINVNGRGRLLSVGKYVPPDWGWVRVTKTKEEGAVIWLRLEKLELREAG